jgi:Enterobacteriaceae phage ATP-dependent target DNA activator
MGSVSVVKLPESPAEPDLRARIQALLDSGEVESRSRIAREAGFSNAALSRWLQGRYEGNNEVVEQKLETWLISRQQRAQTALPDAPEWVDTPTAAKILTTLSFMQAVGDLAVIYGAAGVGKTAALRRYAQTNSNIWIAVVSPAVSGVKACLEEVADAVGMRELPGWTSRLRRELLRRLRDEAQHLQVGALEELRALHDASGIGLVLAGNESVYARLRGGTRTAEFAQLFSRIGRRLYLAGSVADDVKAVMDAWHVHGKEERALLWSIAKTPGALRAVTKTLRLATALAVAEETTLDIRCLRIAYRDLGGDIDGTR